MSVCVKGGEGEGGRGGGDQNLGLRFPLFKKNTFFEIKLKRYTHSMIFLEIFTKKQIRQKTLKKVTTWKNRKFLKWRINYTNERKTSHMKQKMENH